MRNSKTTSTLPPRSPDTRFREEIASAVAQGVPLGGMTLCLTTRDANLLARDRSTPVDDIRFRDGAMHFLGVKVTSGGVDASVLDRGQA